MRDRQQFHERGSQRQAVYIEGKLISPDVSKCIDCVLRDISDGGALVSFRGTRTISGRVYLWQATAGTMIECEVRWTKLNLMGLKFLDTRQVPRLRALAEKIQLNDAHIEPFFRVKRAA